MIYAFLLEAVSPGPEDGRRIDDRTEGLLEDIGGDDPGLCAGVRGGDRSPDFKPVAGPPDL